MDDGCQFSNFIVDEAHIMFDWKDFRPTYSLLPQLESMIRTLNPNLRTLLMTATLNPDEIEKILNKFGRNYSESNVEVIRKSEIRQDLAFTIIKDKNLNYGDFENSTRLMQQEDSIQSHKWRLSKFQYEIDNYSPPLLIYTHEKKHCRQISKKLNYQPKFKNIYHGDTSSDKRRKILLAFMNDEIKSLVATSAFGMGVNKGNIWLTGYIGSPPNLKELYQMFGRTARDSRWNESESKKRNGNCIAIVPTKEKQLSFNPPMKTNASMIRIAEMFSQECKITHNGYVIIPIMMSEISNYLYPQKKEDKIVKWRKKSISDRVVLEKKWKEHEDNFVNGESDKRIKSLLLMQESGAIEIKGLHYENPIIRDGLVGKSLTELLEQGGYNGVLSEISKVGKNNTGFNRIGNKFVIIKITKNIDGEKDFIKFINEGLDKEKTSYEHGVNQLKKLIKSNECIRKGFAPLIGAQNLRTCLDEYINNQSNPLPLGEFAPAPCSVCRCNAGKDKTILKEIRDILFYNEKKPSIWLEEDQIELLSGRKKITDAKEESVFIDIKNCKLNEITMLDYIGGWACDKQLNTDEIKINLCEKIISHFKPKYFIIGGNTKKYEIDMFYKDLENTNITGLKIKFTCLTYGEKIIKITQFNIDFHPSIKLPAGLLLFGQGDNIIAREISEDVLINHHHKWRKALVNYDEIFWASNFIGYKPPWFHEDGSNSW